MFYYFALLAIEALVAGVYLLAIPCDPKNTIFMGYSLWRLAILGALILLFAGSLGMAWLARRRQGRADSIFQSLLNKPAVYRVGLGSAVFFTLAGWILVWTPSSYFGDYAAVHERLLPLFAWGMLFAIQSLIWLLVGKNGFHPREFKAQWSERSSVLRTALIVLAAFLLIWGFISLTHIGLKPDAMFWNEPGVPILGLQVLAGWLVGIILLLVFNRLLMGKQRQGLDVLVFVLLWALAALVWVDTPAQRTYFSPGPYPPNYQVYPFSDAAGYDISAQYALVGQGFGDSRQVDKPLYTFFLFLLHLAAGENYAWIMALQAALLGIFPALLYLLGSRLLNRPVGVLAALLSIFMEVNAYGSGTLIQVSHSKLFLSELPLAAALVAFSLLVVRWFRGDGRHPLAAMASGGVLGFSTLLRHNPWALLPFVLILAVVRYWKEWKTGLKTGLLFMVVFVISIAPWMWRSSQMFDSPLYFLPVAEGVVWEGRYLPAVESQDLGVGELTPGVQVTEPVKTAASPSVVSSTPFPELPSAPPAANSTPAALQGTFSRLESFARFVTNHFFHNLVTSVLILPTTFSLDDLQHTLKTPDSIWNSGWEGSLQGAKGFVLLLNLALIALGVGTSWRRLGLAGVVPFLIFLAYNGATALARTSGGRYIVPIDWVVYLYFGVGVIQGSQWLGSILGWRNGFSTDYDDKIDDPLSQSNPFSVRFWKKGLPIAACFLLIGVSMPVAEMVMPPVYTYEMLNTYIDKTGQQKVSESFGAIDIDFQLYKRSKNIFWGYGRLLYPRYYPANEGEPDGYSANKTLPYPRLVFNVTGLLSGNFVLPLQETPRPLPPGASVWVLGCRKSRWYVDALAMVLIDTGEVILRSPGAPLACPAPTPICDNNGNCH